MLKIYFDRIPGAHRPRDAIYGWCIGQFFLEGAENFIPDNKYLRKIFINVFGVDSMMHPVMRWCYNNLFEETHFVDMPCMIPELRKQLYGCNYSDHCCRHAQ